MKIDFTCRLFLVLLALSLPTITAAQTPFPPPGVAQPIPPAGAPNAVAADNQGAVNPGTAFRAQTLVENLDPSVAIKDITFVHGDRVNKVAGNGLVFGLSGTGGRAEQTDIMARNYFLRRGIQVDTVNTQNMSAVSVLGEIPAYARKGEKILVTVSVLDNASSLRGGMLDRTVLRGIDDEIYAVAEGAIIGGGVSAQGDAGSVTKNHPTVGTCEAIVEREIRCDNIMVDGRIRLVLRNKSYSTATQIANVLNGALPGHARALDPGTLDVFVPRQFQQKLPAFISSIGDLRVRPSQPARVVINQKTGTIVMGHTVKISRVLLASENIVIATSESPIASQPNPLAGGQTALLPRTAIDIVESGGTYNVWREGLSVSDLATALNTLAVSPNTLINVFTSLRNQGALQAELVIE